MLNREWSFRHCNAVGTPVLCSRRIGVFQLLTVVFVLGGCEVSSGLREGLHVQVPEPSDPKDGRGLEPVHSGLVALYEFDESEGAELIDSARTGTATHLRIGSPGASAWHSNWLQVEPQAGIRSWGPAQAVSSAIQSTGEFTIEAWIHAPGPFEDGPAVVIRLGDPEHAGGVRLSQLASASNSERSYTLDLRTGGRDGGLHSLELRSKLPREVPEHVAFVRRRDGLLLGYLNGRLKGADQFPGDITPWAKGGYLELAPSDGASGDWRGQFHRLALYDRALESLEVRQNWLALSKRPLTSDLSFGPVGGLTFRSSTEPGGEELAARYTVSNPGTEPVHWTVDSTSPWVALEEPMAGVLEPGAESVHRVSIDPRITASLDPGAYDALIQWRETGRDPILLEVPVQLTVNRTADPLVRPGPTNTGPRDVGSLKPSESITAEVDGMIIEGVDVVGWIKIAANNVTVRNFRIDGGGAHYGILAGTGNYSGTLIEDGEIQNVASAGIYGANFTARRVSIHRSGGDGVKTLGNVLVESCWIHSIGMKPGAHADGCQTRGGIGITFRGNSIDIPVPESQAGLAGHASNAAFMIQDETGPVRKYLIERNWLNGGNYTILLSKEDYGGPQEVEIRGNRFGRDYRFGTLATDGLSVVTSGNVWDDTGEPMPWEP